MNTGTWIIVRACSVSILGSAAIYWMVAVAVDMGRDAPQGSRVEHRIAMGIAGLCSFLATWIVMASGGLR